MKTLHSRMILNSILVCLLLVPAYAHHGNQFLSRVMEMNAAEVRLGEAAIIKARNTDVKDFAETLVSDHNEFLHRLVDLRTARTTTRATPAAATSVGSQRVWSAARMHRTASDIPITPDHQHILDQLLLLSADDFDRGFISEMVREYREAINLFAAQTHVHGNAAAVAGNQTKIRADRQIAGLKPAARGAETYSLEDLAKDLDTADFARDALPTLCLHLAQAEAIQKRLQKH
jgi:predicted outer membrane protein